MLIYVGFIPLWTILVCARMTSQDATEIMPFVRAFHPYVYIHLKRRIQHLYSRNILAGSVNIPPPAFYQPRNNLLFGEVVIKLKPHRMLCIFRAAGKRNNVDRQRVFYLPGKPYGQWGSKDLNPILVLQFCNFN